MDGLLIIVIVIVIVVIFIIIYTMMGTKKTSSFETLQTVTDTTNAKPKEVLSNPDLAPTLMVETIPLDHGKINTDQYLDFVKKGLDYLVSIQNYKTIDDETKKALSNLNVTIVLLLSKSTWAAYSVSKMLFSYIPKIQKFNEYIPSKELEDFYSVIPDEDIDIRLLKFLIKKYNLQANMSYSLTHIHPKKYEWIKKLYEFADWDNDYPGALKPSYSQSLTTFVDTYPDPDPWRHQRPIYLIKRHVPHIWQHSRRHM
jgi:hypothetical protein